MLADGKDGPSNADAPGGTCTPDVGIVISMVGQSRGLLQAVESALLQFCYAQMGCHCVSFSGSESNGCIQDIARLDTEELCPLTIT
jgi:hypothetical protein